MTEYSKLNLHTWIVTIAGLDLCGAAATSGLVSNIFAAPLDGGFSRAWVGLAAFIGIWCLAARAQRLYSQETFLAGRRMALRSLVACALAFGIILALAFGLDLIDSQSRLWLLAWSAGTLLWVLLLRFAWYLRLRHTLRSGRDRVCLERALVFAGSAESARRVGRAVESESGYRVRVAAGMPLPGLPGAPALAWIENVIRCSGIDRVLIADFEDAKDETNAFLMRLTRLAVDVTLMPNLDGLYTPVVHESKIGFMLAADVVSRPLSAGQGAVKRAEDLAIAGLALLLLAVPMLLIAIAIKLDSRGPVLFRQKRAGFHDTTFRVWKFRTMFHHMQDAGSVQQTVRHDRRVTRVGRFLRRTSLDELPQLFNVLRGEMSVVGPRPHALSMTAGGVPLHEALEEYASRHRLKPGITGWAQVNGCRGEVDGEEKLRRRISLDCFYIENWSLALDAWILARTLSLVALDREAY